MWLAFMWVYLEGKYFIVSPFSCVWLFNSTTALRFQRMTLFKRRCDILQDDPHVGFLLVFETLWIQVYTFLITALPVYAGRLSHRPDIARIRQAKCSSACHMLQYSNFGLDPFKSLLSHVCERPLYFVWRRYCWHVVTTSELQAVRAVVLSSTFWDIPHRLRRRSG